MSGAGLLHLRISSLAHDGRGIGFLDSCAGARGKAVFVAGALPGQSVVCRPANDKGSWLDATLVEIRDKGENTCRPHCAHAEICGGCPLQGMPYARQLEWKENIVLSAMRRIGSFSDIADVWQKIVPSPRLRAFRNKIGLAFGAGNTASTILGFRKKGSHEVFDLRDCALMDKDALPIIAAMREIARNGHLPADFWRFFVLRRGFDKSGQGIWLAVCITMPGGRKERRIARQAGEALLAACPFPLAFIHEERRGTAPVAKGEKRIACLNAAGWDRPGAEAFYLPLGKRFFRLDAASFFQVNGEASDRLAALVLDMDAKSRGRAALLDAFCGVGAPGQLLAPRYASLAGVENDAMACACAAENAAGLPGCRYHAEDAGNFMENLAKNGAVFSTALLDPPRQGLDKRALSALLRLRPENIIYISCNPATLARDSRELGKHYTLASLGCVDLFPHTAHVESCAFWIRKT